MGFQRILSLADAKPLSEAGLLWYKYAGPTQEWQPDKDVGYWSREDVERQWHREASANVWYAILLEE